MRSSRSSLALPSAVSSSTERFLGRFSITWAAISQRPHAPAPYGTSGLLPSSPNHFRILADKLRVICIGTSLPPPSAQWPVRSTRKERLGKRKGSRSPEAGPGGYGTAWCASCSGMSLAAPDPFTDQARHRWPSSLTPLPPDGEARHPFGQRSSDRAEGRQFELLGRPSQRMREVGGHVLSKRRTGLGPLRERRNGPESE